MGNVTSIRQPDCAEVIAVLEEALLLARAGRLNGVFISAVRADYQDATFSNAAIAKGASWLELIGAANSDVRGVFYRRGITEADKK